MKFPIHIQATKYLSFGDVEFRPGEYITATVSATQSSKSRYQTIELRSDRQPELVVVFTEKALENSLLFGEFRKV